MRLKIAYSKIKKRNLVLINNDTHQRETLSERPIRPPLSSRWRGWNEEDKNCLCSMSSKVKVKVSKDINGQCQGELLEGAKVPEPPEVS